MSEEKINHAPEDAAAAAEAELNAKLAKPSLMDIFVRGARKGWNIAIDNIIPNVLMAYVCIKILNVTGLLTLAGKFFAPVMAIWGLPGEAIMVLFSALMSMGGAVRVGDVATVTDSALLVSAWRFITTAASMNARLPSLSPLSTSWVPRSNIWAVCWVLPAFLPDIIRSCSAFLS